jgi:replication initiation and membrane attachment protein
MKISNILQFTENHRYCVYRNFSLSPLDDKMLSTVYQPMVGAFAIGFYYLLYRHLAADQAGYSSLEQQRRLFHTLDLEPNEKGRKFLIEQASKLEAVGLLQTFRRYISETDEHLYEYELAAPLLPDEFFQNQHLTLLLRDKVGKFMALELRERFLSKKPEELPARTADDENISVPFYELFRLNTRAVDPELERALGDPSPARPAGGVVSGPADGLHYSDIITRFPRQSANRAYVERLCFEKEQMAAINYVVHKYGLTVQDICRLLDEEGVFSDNGELRIDALQHKANLTFRQSLKREGERQRYLHKVVELNRGGEPEPQAEQPVDQQYYLEIPEQLAGQCDIHQYNLMLRNEPYIAVLKRFFPGTVPQTVLDIFERLDLQYKLREEVINVLIHYIVYYNKDWKKSFIDSIASDMLGKQIDRYEKAVQYFRDYVNRQEQLERSKSAKTPIYRRGAYGKPKPQIPIISNVPRGQTLSKERQDEIRRLARELDGKS